MAIGAGAADEGESGPQLPVRPPAKARAKTAASQRPRRRAAVDAVIEVIISAP